MFEVVIQPVVAFWFRVSNGCDDRYNLSGTIEINLILRWRKCV